MRYKKNLYPYMEESFLLSGVVHLLVYKYRIYEFNNVINICKQKFNFKRF